ncbi:uncharacterized protein LOC132197742 [Neocloeon triangulifer]|uniref:uncharacterized protein LOC132197742 n=1 Tax=Neocloeon triangulifer TaxID=2078957 RepID=UPI00286EDD58|nr:uncharacterized protein LOC132197742 [Neocloeon triangulifer]
MPQRLGRQLTSRQLAGADPPRPQQPLFQQPSQLPQPPASIRNPWAGGADSDHGTSSSASVPPPRPQRQIRTRSNSIGSTASSRTASRNLGAPGCCSPGAQLVCHYCLRAALLCCLLCGGALAVAGAILQRHDHEDLGVLLYIGVLAALVSLVLLIVQWRSHRPPRLRPRGPQVPIEEAVPLQELRQQQIVYMPHQQTSVAGHAPWQGINPYQYQHGLSIPQQSARSEDMLSMAGESSRMAGRANRPASIAMVPAAARLENPAHPPMWWRPHQQPRPPVPTKPIYQMNQNPS